MTEEARTNLRKTSSIVVSRWKLSRTTLNLSLTVQCLFWAICNRTFLSFSAAIVAGTGQFGEFMHASTSSHAYTQLNPSPTHQAVFVEMLLGLVPFQPRLA